MHRQTSMSPTQPALRAGRGMLLVGKVGHGKIRQHAPDPSCTQEHLDEISVNAPPEDVALLLKLVHKLSGIQVRPLPQGPAIQRLVF